jgi:hypothetical protein
LFGNSRVSVVLISSKVASSKITSPKVVVAMVIVVMVVVLYCVMNNFLLMVHFVDNVWNMHSDVNTGMQHRDNLTEKT